MHCPDLSYYIQHSSHSLISFFRFTHHLFLCHFKMRQLHYWSPWLVVKCCLYALGLACAASCTHYWCLLFPVYYFLPSCSPIQLLPFLLVCSTVVWNKTACSLSHEQLWGTATHVCTYSENKRNTYLTQKYTQKLCFVYLWEFILM